MNIKQMIVEAVSDLSIHALIQKHGFEARPTKTSKTTFDAKKWAKDDQEHSGAKRLVAHLQKTGWKKGWVDGKYGYRGNHKFTHPEHGSIELGATSQGGYSDESIVYNPKRAPIGNKPLPKGGIKAAVHSHLETNGYEHTKNEVTNTKGRYTSHKGIPDGDYPNAYQTNIHNEQHEFVKSGDKEAFNNLHQHLVDHGFKHNTWKYGAKTINMYNRGDHTVHVEHNTKIVKVKHSSRTTTPDHEYTRSGKGVGQII